MCSQEGGSETPPPAYDEIYGNNLDGDVESIEASLKNVPCRFITKSRLQTTVYYSSQLPDGELVRAGYDNVPCLEWRPSKREWNESLYYLSEYGRTFTPQTDGVRVENVRVTIDNHSALNIRIHACTTTLAFGAIGNMGSLLYSNEHVVANGSAEIVIHHNPGIKSSSGRECFKKHEDTQEDLADHDNIINVGEIYLSVRSPIWEELVDQRSYLREMFWNEVNPQRRSSNVTLGPVQLADYINARDGLVAKMNRIKQDYRSDAMLENFKLQLTRADGLAWSAVPEAIQRIPNDGLRNAAIARFQNEVKPINITLEITFAYDS